MTESQTSESISRTVTHGQTGPASAKDWFAGSQGEQQLQETVNRVTELIAPVWPLQDYVAVNPYMGLADEPFLSAVEALQSVSDATMLPKPEEFLQDFREGVITAADIETAVVRVSDETAANVPKASAILERMERSSDDVRDCGTERKILTIAECVDRETGSEWMSTVRDSIGLHCASWYDRGQGLWESPFRSESFFGAWKQAAMIDRRPAILGLPDFRAYISKLPETPLESLQQCLSEINLPRPMVQVYLWAAALSISGWSSWARYQVFENAKVGQDRSDFLELLAIRVAWDAAIYHQFATTVKIQVDQRDPQAARKTQTDVDDALVRYTLLTAREIAFQRDLLEGMTPEVTTDLTSSSAGTQVVFCIDVRSERIRRHLEAADQEIATFGFAGFFGVPMSLRNHGESTAQPQVPAPLSPSFEATESLRGKDEASVRRTLVRRHATRMLRKRWKQFQTSATSCFAFVETAGLTFLWKLFQRTTRLQRPHSLTRFDGVSEPDRHALGLSLPDCLTDEQEADCVQMAAGILKGTSLASGPGELVVFCGHGSTTENNPLNAALDCGACCGHTGEANARYAASLLNHPQVRAGLKQQGITVPEQTRFLAALHDTSDDTIRFFDTDLLPESHRGRLEDLKTACRSASTATVRERMPQLHADGWLDMTRRGKDWSEVRPEWGLAGNAAFVIGRRSLTKESPFAGRIFLHSYDAGQDVGGAVLEQIMTAPMVVGHWINMQYYASTVDNANYGSGTKTIHNVVGQFGMYSGNGGDLQTGLPIQCVHDGTRFQHSALRLTAVIEAPRETIRAIIGRHELLQQLIRNRWLTLVCVDGGQFYRCRNDLAWSEASVPETDLDDA